MDRKKIVWVAVIVMFFMVGSRVFTFVFNPEGKALQAVGNLLCPENSTFKTYSSDGSWYRDGRTHYGTRYSFDCVNSSGGHVDNHIDFIFGSLLAACVLLPVLFILGWIFFPKKKVQQESMHDKNTWK